MTDNYICPTCWRVVVQERHDCTRQTQLRASRPAQLTATVGLIDAAPDILTSRTLSGLALPLGEVGLTSIGPVEVDPACVLDFPADLTDVVLVDEHQEPPAPIGYLEAQRQVEGQGWRMSFHVAELPEGDRALLLADRKVKRGFSVELDNLRWNTFGRLIRASVVRVAHVVTPAFPSARHDGLAASHTHREEHRMLTDEQRARLAELLAMPADQLTPELTAERDQLLGQSTAEDMAAVTQLAIASGAEQAPADQADQAPADQGQLAASRAQGGAAVIPGSLANGQGTQTRARTRPLRELYAATARVLSGNSRPAMEAALSDITMTGNIWTMADGYAGELWSGLNYARRYVANSMPGNLDAIKGTGWRWVIKPAVADYAGDKAAVPSNAPTTEDTEWNAARIAGAHDIDRAHFDFGNTAFIESYYQAMREDYAVKSDLKALAFQLASAVDLGAATTSLFRAVATAAQAVEDNTLGQAVDFVYVNSGDRLDLIDVLSDGIPAYLELFGVTPETFRAAPGVSAGSVVVGTKQATRFRELTETPIRVEAINVANGGIDGGVFGYYATEEIFPGGIVKQTWA